VSIGKGVEVRTGHPIGVEGGADSRTVIAYFIFLSFLIF
jgi:hypothetical protein